jgi:hypothetical protein
MGSLYSHLLNLHWRFYGLSIGLVMVIAGGVFLDGFVMMNRAVK